MRILNKTVSIILSVMMILSIIPLTASAAEYTGKCGDNVFWEFNSSTGVFTVFGSGDMEDYNVTFSDGRAWREYIDLITSVYIEEGVTSIGERSFYKCTALKKVTISNSVTSINRAAFMRCSELDCITIGEGMKEISYYEAIPHGVSIYYAGTVAQWYEIEKNSSENFSEQSPVQCSDGDLAPSRKFNKEMQWRLGVGGILTISGEGEINDQVKKEQLWKNYNSKIKKVVIEEGVTAIGSNSFYNCDNLTDITIPNSVVTINFDFAPVLTTINYNGTSAEWEQVLENNNKANLNLFKVKCTDETLLPHGSCGENLTWLFDSDTGELTISGTGDMYDYIVDYEDFINLIDTRPWGKLMGRVKQIVVCEGVTSIGAYAFACQEEIEPQIESVMLPTTLLSIGNFAFQYCETLTDISIPANLTTIGTDAFAYCENLERIALGDKVTSIGSGAFSWCLNLEKVILGEGITSIEHSVFFHCRDLKEINLPTTITSIGSAAFSYSGLTNFVIPKDVSAIELRTFAGCSELESVTIGNQVTRIGNSAFEYCGSLKTIFIPESVKQIGSTAINGCKSLENICVAEDNPYYSSDKSGVLFNKDKTILLQYPSGNKREKYVVPDSVITIDEYAINKSNNLKTIVFGEGTQQIKYMAFAYSKNLETIIIKNKINYLGLNAFYECNNLSDIYYFGSVEQWADISTIFPDYAKVHFNCKNTVVSPTCTKHGITEYTCECCGVYDWEYSANPTGHTLNDDGVCEVCGDKEVSTSPVNTQMLSIESVFAMIISLLAKLFGIFAVA